MSGFTITAGVSFSGGFTFTEMPPNTNTEAWFGGGYGSSAFRTTVDRITYATDTATASVRGPLTAARYELAGVGNTTDGWFGGGRSPSGGGSRVDRITYATDTATASVRGPLSAERSGLAAAGNTTDSWWAGGWDTYYSSMVNKITYATDTATAISRGGFPGAAAAREYIAAAGNTYDGWWGGGIKADGSTCRVDRITYATDTAASVVRGPLSLARRQLSATGNSDYGWFGGGASDPTSRVDRITYATDTNTASTRGPLGSYMLNFAAASNMKISI